MAATTITTTIPASINTMAAPIATPSALLSRVAAPSPVLSPAVTTTAAAPTTGGSAVPQTTGAAAAATQQRAAKRPRAKATADDEAAVAAGVKEIIAKAEPKAKAARGASANKSTEAKKVVSESADEAPTNGVVAATEETTTEKGKDWLIVAKSVRAMLKAMPNGMHCGADALPMLNTRVQEMLTEAASRASGNGRKTLKGCDF